MSENVSNQWSTPTLGLVSIWLCLALARQAFDLIGRLWLPVIFNLLQILCCIIGLFAVCQRRRALLGVFIVTSLLSTIYNILLLLWYEDVFPSSTHYTIPLSFGLPLSFSFFLKYTPGCSSHFDLQKSFYVQDDCLIRFTHLEAAQCVLHMLFAISTMITTILMLCERDVNKRKIKGKTHSLPTVSIESIPRSNGRPLSRVPPSILDTGSVRSGYVNSSYDSRDDVNGVRTSPNYRQDPIHAFPNANYEDPQDPQENRQPATQLQYSKRKSGGQNVENARSKPPNQIDQRQSGLFRKARDHRQNRHSRLPPEYPSLHSDPHSHSKSVPQPSPLHSLVSFDPKKGRNFLTVQERVPSDESDDETISDESPVSDDRRNDDIEPRKEIIPKRDLSLDAQYSKVQKRNQPKPQMRSTSQRDLPNEPSSYRDAIDHGNGKSSLRLRKDQGIDQEEDQEDDEIGIDDPAYERISVYRRLGEAKSIKNERMPDSSLNRDYSPGNDGSSSDSGIHSGTLPIDWPPPPPPNPSNNGRPREGMFRKSWRQSQPHWDFPNPPPVKGLRRVNTAEMIENRLDDEIHETGYQQRDPEKGYAQKNDELKLMRQSPGSSLAEVIRQSIRKSSLMSLEDSTSSSASINGITSSMASVSGVSDGRKSRFQIEQRNNSAIGHYHSAIEMKLVTPVGSITSGQRQTSLHRLSQVPGLTTALGLSSNVRKSEPNNNGRDYGICLMKEMETPGIRLRSSINPYEKFEKTKSPMISDDSLLV